MPVSYCGVMNPIFFYLEFTSAYRLALGLDSLNLEGFLHDAFVVNPDFCMPDTRHHFPLMVETVSRLAYSAVNAKIFELVIGSFEMGRRVDLPLGGYRQTNR